MKAVDRVLAWDAGCLSPGGPRFGPGVADELQHQPIVVLEGNHLPRWPLKRDSVTHQPLDPESQRARDRKSTRLNSSHSQISYAVFCLKKKKQNTYKTL